MVKTLSSFKSLLAFGLLGLATTAPTFAQTARWNLPDLDLSEGKVSAISLVFDNCSPDGNPKIPKVDGLDDFGKPVGKNSSTQVTMDNFKINRVEHLIYSYYITPQRQGRIEIPAFDVDTDKGKVRVAALSLDISEGRATMQQSGSQIISSSLETTANTVWLGQIFPIRYELLLLIDEQAAIASDPNIWKPSELVVEDWSRFQNIRKNVGGYNRQGRLYQTTAYATKAGNLEIAPLEMEAEVASGNSFGFFGRSSSERITLKSNPLKLTVKELPKPAPASFTGAVGQFQLSSKLTQTEVTAGQPVTWTLTLKGTGNWPDNFKMPARDVPSNLRVIQPEAKKENAPEKIFEATLTEDVVLIPDHAGNIDLAPVQFTFFNPEKGVYETLSTEAFTLKVTADPNRLTQSHSPTALAPALQDNVNPVRPKTEPDLSKPQLPRDPIPGSASTFTPFSNLIVAGASTALVLGLFPFWLLLARRHSVQTAKITRQRKALDRALLTVKEIEGAREEAQRKNLLLRWQHLVSIGFAVEQATPSLKQLESSASMHLDETWLELWRDADSALYSANPNLPEDWVTRARASSAKLRLPGVPLHKSLSPQHLFPLVVALLFLPLTQGQAAGEDPLAAYQKGNFQAAEKGWLEQVRAHPGDWIAHNNLGLALAQEKEWGPAVAQWASAFLRSPNHPDVEWNLALGLSHLDNAIPELNDIQKSEALPALARQLSPFQWQALSLSAVLASVLAAGFMLFQRYHPGSALRKIHSGIPAGLLVVGAISFVVALTALRTYGVLGDARAGMIVSKTELKSVPTDADSKQATREIDTGMVVLAEKSFLGWWKVRLANNETGWVRQEHLHRLYH